MYNEIKCDIRIRLWTTEVILDISSYWSCNEFPFARLNVLREVCSVVFLLYVYSVSIVRPRPKLHSAVLCVKRKVSDIYSAFTAQHHRRKPHVLAVVEYLNTSRQAIKVSTEIDRFIRAGKGNYTLSFAFRQYQPIFSNL